MQHLALFRLLFPFGGISKSLSLEEMRAAIDRDFMKEIEDVVLNSNPGNPCDRTASRVLRKYGIFHAASQARLLAAISRKMRDHCAGPEGNNGHAESLLPCLYLALAGFSAELVIGHFSPRMMHMQAFTVAEIFSWIGLDVEEEEMLYTGG